MEKIFSCSFLGLDCKIIEVETDISRGLPSFSIVGLGDASVQESKERVRASIKNSNAVFPATRKIINLAPAQIRKHGSLFDLPIAVSILHKSKQLKSERLRNSVLVGELSLSGTVKAVKGIAAITHYVKQKGFNKIFLPEDNSLEASFINGIEIIPVKSLRELIEYCNENKKITLVKNIDFNAKRKQSNLFSEIVGLDAAKRGVLIAAAGNHNVLMRGSPGCGKTLLARSITSLLPVMSREESLQTTKIFSIAGCLNAEEQIVLNRPFREVHHSASLTAVVGGGKTTPIPGEISMAHNGVLFFDEISEFGREVLEALRQPLEDRSINVSRHGFSVKFPSNFIFIGTSNPCPCGYYKDRKIQCMCRKFQVEKYQKKISGPLLDRFDIFLTIERSSMNKVFQKNQASNPENSRAKVMKARKIQNKRFEDNRKIKNNADMGIKEIREFCRLDKESEKIMKKASENLNLSNRAYLKVLKLARTIADIENCKNIKTNHISESIQFINR